MPPNDIFNKFVTSYGNLTNMQWPADMEAEVVLPNDTMKSCSHSTTFSQVYIYQFFSVQQPNDCYTR